MGVTTTNNKPLNPRGNDQSPLAFNRAKLYSGKALDFDGVNDYVQGSNVCNSLTSLSVSFLVKLDAVGALQILFDEREGSSDGVSAYIESSNNFTFTINGTYSVGQLSLKASEWYFVSATWDGSTIKTYINGIEDSNASYSGSISTATGYKLAQRAYATGIELNGQLSNAKVFNTALTATQVADLYNNPEKVVPTGVDNTALKLWLPMQEGAGTTAYDGSGNGNHGTISGATYTHGIGAPVSQTAVIDWNKGSNFVRYSEDFSNAAWVKAANNATLVVTGNYATAPNGTSTADRIQMSQTAGGSNYSQLYYLINGVTNGVSHTWSVWLKSLSGTPTIGIGYDGSNWSTITLTTEWKEYKITKNTLATTINADLILYGALSTSLSADFLAWGFSVRPTSAGDAYIPTFATAQTSPVLLPQGLTTGRDITGVNLFENVRKQGALNLDGNSWAEVHDNASLDLTTDISVEAWVYWGDEGVSDGIIGKGGDYLLYVSASKYAQFYLNGSYGTNAYLLGTNTGWYHIVGTYDGTSQKIYINGSLENTQARTGSINLTNKVLDVGRYNSSSGTEYTNQIAQPRIYNRALTAAEVQKNYNAGKNIYTN